MRQRGPITPPRTRRIRSAALGLLFLLAVGIAVAAVVAVRRGKASSVPAPEAAARPEGRAPADTRSSAQALSSEGRHREAIALLQAAVREGPYDEGLEYQLGETMASHASPQEMIAFFSGEVGRDPKPQTCHYFWAMGLARAGDASAAIAQLRRGLEVDPAHEMSQRLWGVLLERQGQLEPALSHYVEATRIHPEFRDALQDAARVAGRLGRAEEAASYAGRARSANPNTSRCYFYWARYLHEHGRNAAAWPEVQKAVSVAPGDAETLRLRDEIAASLGRAGVPS